MRAGGSFCEGVWKVLVWRCVDVEGVDVMCGCDVCVMCECGDVWMWSVGMCDG